MNYQKMNKFKGSSPRAKNWAQSASHHQHIPSSPKRSLPWFIRAYIITWFCILLKWNSITCIAYFTFLYCLWDSSVLVQGASVHEYVYLFWTFCSDPLVYIFILKLTLHSLIDYRYLKSWSSFVFKFLISGAVKRDVNDIIHQTS